MDIAVAAIAWEMTRRVPADGFTATNLPAPEHDKLSAAVRIR
jgi:hypothetical protein